MLTDKDIQKLKAELATKKDLERFTTKEDLKEELKRFATKEDLDERTGKLLQEIFTTKEDLEIFKEEMKKNFSDLQTAIDAYAKKVDTFAQEMIMLAHKVDRHEKWLHQIAEKLGVKLEY
jgi:DNA polymerase III delta prime subunit